MFLLVDAVHLKTDTKLYSRDCCSRLKLFIFMQHEEKEVIHYEGRKPGSFSSVQLALKTFLCRWLQYFWKTSKRNDSGLPPLNSLPLGQNIGWSTSQLCVAFDSGTKKKNKKNKYYVFSSWNCTSYTRTLQVLNTNTAWRWIKTLLHDPKQSSYSSFLTRGYLVGTSHLPHTIICLSLEMLLNNWSRLRTFTSYCQPSAKQLATCKPVLTPWLWIR